MPITSLTERSVIKVHIRMFGYRDVRLSKLGFCRFDNRTFGYRGSTVFVFYENVPQISDNVHKGNLNLSDINKLYVTKISLQFLDWHKHILASKYFS